MELSSTWGLFSERIDKPRERGQLEGYESLSQLIDGEKIALYINCERSVCIIGSQLNYWKGRSNRYTYIEKFVVPESVFDIRRLLNIFFKHMQEALQPDETLIGLGNSQNNWEKLQDYLDSGYQIKKGPYFPFIYGKILLNLPIHILCPEISGQGTLDGGRPNSPIVVDIIKSLNLVIEVIENISKPVRDNLVVAVCDDFKKTSSNFDIIIHPEKKLVTDYNQKKFFGDPISFDLNLSFGKLLIHPDACHAAERVVDLYKEKIPTDTNNYRQYTAELLRKVYLSRYPDDLRNKNLMKSDIGFELGSEFIREKLLGTEPVKESELRLVYDNIIARDSGDLFALLAKKGLLLPEVIRDVTPIIILKNNYELFKSIARMPVEGKENQQQVVSNLDEVLEKIDWSETNNRAFNNGIGLVKKAIHDSDVISYPLGNAFIKRLMRKLEGIQELTTEFTKQELQIVETKQLSKKTKSRSSVILIIILIIAIAAIAGGIMFYYYLLPHSEAETNLSFNNTSTPIVPPGDILLPAITVSPEPTFIVSGETDVCLSAFNDNSRESSPQFAMVTTAPAPTFSPMGETDINLSNFTNSSEVNEGR